MAQVFVSATGDNIGAAASKVYTWPGSTPADPDVTQGKVVIHVADDAPGKIAYDINADAVSPSTCMGWIAPGETLEFSACKVVKVAIYSVPGCTFQDDFYVSGLAAWN